MGLRRSLIRALGGGSKDPVDRWRPKPLDRATQKSFQILDALDETRALGGAVVECGVGSGQSLAMFSYFLDGKDDDRPLYAFDSFQGFPEGTDEDAGWFSPDRMKVYQAFDVAWVREFIREVTGQPGLGDRPICIEGFFPDSFSEYPGTPVSLLHLDVDLYASYVACFEFFEPLLQPGAVILLDEYDRGNDEEKWPGAKRAVDEFADARGLTVDKHYSGFSSLRLPV